MIVETPPLGTYVWPLREKFDGTFFRFVYRYNRRDGFWYLKVSTDSGVVMVAPLRLVLDTDILAPYKSLAVPQGSLNVIRLFGTGDPTRDSLLDEVQLQYVEV